MIDATRSGIIEKPVIASMAKSVIFFNGYFVVPAKRRSDRKAKEPA